MPLASILLRCRRFCLIRNFAGWEGFDGYARNAMFKILGEDKVRTGVGGEAEESAHMGVLGVQGIVAGPEPRGDQLAPVLEPYLLNEDKVHRALSFPYCVMQFASW